MNQKKIEEIRERLGYVYQEDRMKTTNGVYATATLFFETATSPYAKDLRPTCPFTTKDQDYRQYLSFKRLYMEIGDPTEYTTALVLLSGWDHWQRMLSSCWWFRDLVSECRQELRVKMESELVSELRGVARDKGHKSQLQAIKTLLTYKPDWFGAEVTISEKDNKAPSMEDLHRKNIEEDWARLGIKH